VNSNLVLINNDFANAFNSIRRYHIFNSIDDQFPELKRLFYFLYYSSNEIYDVKGEKITECKSGVRQGDPLGPLFFSLGIHPILKQLNDSYPRVKVMAYLDDILFLGNDRDCIAAFQTLRDEAAKIGLLIKSEKCILYSIHGDVSPLLTQVIKPPTLSVDGMRILGSYVGTDAFIREKIQIALHEDHDICDTIKHLNPITGFHLLQTCVNARPVYLSRTSNPVFIKEFGQRFDDAMDKTIMSLLGSEMRMPNYSSTIRHLSAVHGGLGIKKLIHSLSQYISSFLSACKWLESNLNIFYRMIMVTSPKLHTLLQYIKQIKPTESLVNLQRDDESREHHFHLVSLIENDKIPTSKIIRLSYDLTIQDRLYNLELPKNMDGLRAWYRSQCAHGTLLWYQASTSLNPYFGLTKDDFKMNVKLRLLLPVFPDITNRTWRCLCEETVPLLHGYHVLGCEKFGGLYTRRHDEVKKSVIKFLSDIGMKNGLQAEVPLHHNNSTIVADIRYIADGDKYVEVTVVSPAAKRYIAARSATTSEAAGEMAFTQKQMKYVEHDESLLTKVRYFIMEATGRIIKRSYDWIDEVSKMNQVAQTPDATKKRARKHFLKSLSAQMARTQAAMVRRFLDNATLTVPV